MRFINKANNENISEACKIAHDLIEFRESKLHRAISEKVFKWARNNDEKAFIGGHDASARLRNGPMNIAVKPYRPGWRFSRAIAMTKGGGVIFFNEYKLNKLSVIDIASTLCHEYSHECGFSHGGNLKTKYKCEWSLPYYLSENVSKWL